MRASPRSEAPSAEQLKWIEARDRVGLAIDDYLSTHPTAEMRATIEELEDVLRVGDRTAGIA